MTSGARSLIGVFLFVPALTLTTYSMQISSALFTVRERYKWRGPDTAMLWAHFALYYVGVPLLLGHGAGSEVRAIADTESVARR